MTILNEYMQMPQKTEIGIALFTLLATAMLIVIIVSIRCLMDDKKDAEPWIILAASAVALVGFTIGIIGLLGQREYVVQATFDDSYPIAQVMDTYKVQSIDGKIYTLIEKAP